MADNILTFTDENGAEIELEVVDSFELNDAKYVALATPEKDENDETEVDELYIMRIESESDGQDIYVAIEDEAELDRAFLKFQERCEEDFDIID